MTDQTASFSLPGYTELIWMARGGFSSVYRSTQLQYNRPVAVKVLDVGLDDERSRRQYQRECEATGRLTGHPNIVTVLDSGFTPAGKPFLVMDLCVNGTMSDRLAREGPLPVADVLRTGVKIAGALETAHQGGILHRDLKPANILVTAYGEPALSDFGIAAVTSQMEASVTMSAMTPNHAPPEVLEGHRPTPASDIYSLASTLYTLLAGRPPFAQESGHSILAFITRVLTAEVPPIPRHDIPPALTQALVTALAKDPADRQGSAALFGYELQQIQVSLGMPYSEMITRTFAVAEPPAAAAGTPPSSAAPGATPPPSTAPGATPPSSAADGATWADPHGVAPAVTGTSGITPPVAPGATPPSAVPPAIAPAAGVAATTGHDPHAVPGAAAPAAAAPADVVAPPAPPLDPGAPMPVGDATVLRPGSEVPAAVPPATGPAAGPTATGDGSPTIAPPAPQLDGRTPAAGDLTVHVDRHAPVIERVEVEAPDDRRSKTPLVVAVAVLVLVVLAGGAFLLTRGSADETASTTDTTAAPTSTAPATTDTTTAGDPSTTAGGSPTSTSGPTGPTTTGAPATGTAPEGVAADLRDADGEVVIDVSWRNPTETKLPVLYQLLAADGSTLGRISTLSGGTSSVIISETEDGPLSSDQTYCVAVGFINQSAQGVWAPAACTDGSTLQISR